MVKGMKRESEAKGRTYTAVDGAAVADTLALQVIRALLPAALVCNSLATGKRNWGGDLLDLLDLLSTLVTLGGAVALCRRLY